MKRTHAPAGHKVSSREFHLLGRLLRSTLDSDGGVLSMERLGPLVPPTSDQRDLQARFKCQKSRLKHKC
eukprot:1597365-Amphidinium_carterae.1